MPETLSRLPLSLEEEHTLGSMSRWMRFMAVVGICGGIVMLLVLMLGTGIYSSLHAVARLGGANDQRAARITEFVTKNGALPYLFALAVLAFAAITLWQNMLLFHAGDDFHLVATTDTADLDYLTKGLDRLRSFFKIQVLMVLAAVAVAFLAGVVVAILSYTT